MKNNLICWVVFLIFLLQINHSAGNSCGYQSCDLGKPGMLNVHLVSHTHDDVGWLKTVDQYFYGDKNEIQDAGIQYIITSVIQQLYNDPNKKFIYVEIAYFYRWWNQQNDGVKSITKELVNQGRLQFILGGWSMNDEAASHYVDIIDQHTTGLQFLNQTFGDCGRPLVAWQIDPFGHSQEQAALFTMMGYDALYFMRLDYQDKNQRMISRTMEFLWQGSKDLGDKSNLFTGVLYDTYCPPAHFCFDELCDDTPVMDDVRLKGYNVPQRIDDFINYAMKQSSYFTTNHIMIPMGCDFQYQNALKWYTNLDKLIYYTNLRQQNGSKVNLIYSTPSCYTYAVNQVGQVYTLKTDDFFPYADSSNSFWTGYFTSRAALKRYVRQTSNYLQVCKQVNIMLDHSKNVTQPMIDILRQAMGVLQHHDAVSGTEKQHVAYDYAESLSMGIAACQKSLNLAMNSIFGTKTKFGNNGYTLCPLLNISVCDYNKMQSKTTSFTVTLYNSASQSQEYWLRLPIQSSRQYTVRNVDGTMVPFDIVPITKRTINIPERIITSETADNEMVFRTNIPALSFMAYGVTSVKTARKQKPSGSSKSAYCKQHNCKSGIITIGNQKIQLTFDGFTGLMTNFKNLISNIEIEASQSIQYYEGFQSLLSRPSGAYIFRPSSNEPISFPNPKITNVIKTGRFEEIYQEFSPWATQVVRVYDNSSYAEIEWTVGPIPNKDKVGREVILNYKTNINSNGTFYTDANGRQILTRKRNYRESWDFTQSEPVSGNYYPINSRIFIKDESTTSMPVQFTVLNDRSQGGGSIEDGQFEIMVHRITILDDSLGVGEPLNELGADNNTLIVRGKHYMHLDFKTQAAYFHRITANNIYHEPVAFFHEQSNLSSPMSSNLMDLNLPPNVQVLTLENWDDNAFLLRLEHIFQYGEHPIYSLPVSVDLKTVFSNKPIATYEIMTLSANQNKDDSDAKKLHWKYINTKNDKVKTRSNQTTNNEDSVITLNPMDIITLKVYFVR